MNLISFSVHNLNPTKLDIKIWIILLPPPDTNVIFPMQQAINQIIVDTQTDMIDSKVDMIDSKVDMIDSKVDMTDKIVDMTDKIVDMTDKTADKEEIMMMVVMINHITIDERLKVTTVHHLIIPTKANPTHPIIGKEEYLSCHIYTSNIPTLPKHTQLINDADTFRITETHRQQKHTYKHTYTAYDMLGPILPHSQLRQNDLYTLNSCRL